MSGPYKKKHRPQDTFVYEVPQGPDNDFSITYDGPDRLLTIGGKGQEAGNLVRLTTLEIESLRDALNMVVSMRNSGKTPEELEALFYGSFDD